MRTWRLYRSTPPLDGEWRGLPRTIEHSGQSCLSSMMTSSTKSSSRDKHLPACMGIASSHMGTGSMQTVPYSLCTSITSLQTDMASVRTEVH